MTRGEIWVALLRAVRAHHLQLRHSLIGAAHTADALLTTSLAGVVTASGNTALSQGCAGALLAGRDATLTSSGSILLPGAIWNCRAAAACCLLIRRT